MLNKNISKFFAFVISLSAFSGCSLVSPQREPPKSEKISANYQPPKIVGKISTNEITESSGIAASRCQKDILWTHNDSGNDPLIFALNPKGEKLGTWKVVGTKNVDWEDIAEFKDKSGACFLYIGDIGNNTRVRSEFTIYRVKEPPVSVGAESSNKKNPLETDSAEAIKISYPETRHDAETLMVHPQTGDIYILSKRISGASGVYKLKSDFNLDKTNKLEKIADLSVPAIPDGFLTGGDISPDGRRVVLCDYFGAYELILPDSAKNFDEIWKVSPEKIELGEREQGEAVGYAADGNSIFATSEKKNSPLIEVKRK